jgi:hypothetical protein
MATKVGSALPQELLDALGQAELPSRLRGVLPLITVDAEGRPHPMLCSYLEVLAVNSGTIRVAIAGSGRSARNLEERRAATLIVVDPERTVYVKCRASGVPLTLGAFKRFELRVEEVLEDAADPSEGPVRITSGISYGPPPSLDDPRVRSTLDALRRA